MIDNNISLYEAVRRSAEKFPNCPALEYMNKSIKYREFIRQIDRVAEALQNLGIGEGNIVTLCLPNIPEAVYLFYAISKIKAIAHMTHPLTKAEQMEKFLKNIPTKAIFIIHTFTDGYFSLAKKLGIKIVTCNPSYSLPLYKRVVYNACNSTPKRSENHIKYADLFKLPAKNAVNSANRCTNNFNDNMTDLFKLPAKNAVNSVDNRPNNFNKNTAVILHSGGTSGEPKAIELSANAINALAAKGSYILNMENLSNKYMLSVLPMFHGFGLTMGIHALLTLGGCDAIMPKFHRDSAIKLLAKGKINFIIGVPILYNALLSHPKFCGKKLQNIEVAFVGGDFVPKNLMTHFDCKILESGGHGRLFEGYGLTETVTVACVNTHQNNRVGSVGKTLPGIQIEAFCDEKILARNTCGELYISGDTLMEGYLTNDKNAIKDEFFCSSDAKSDENGAKIEETKWIRTGDYGYVDSDGYVFFMQRLKRIIKVSGINVFPSEIENLIIDQPNVTNVCALEVSNQARGAMIKLYVETSAPKEQHSSLEREFSNLVANHIGAHARPESIIFLSKFPLTSVGKINAVELSKL